MEDILIPLLTFSLIVGGSLFKSIFSNNESDDAEPTSRKRSNQGQKPTIKPEYQPTNIENKPQKSTNLESDMTAAQTGSQKNKQLEELRKSLNVSSKKQTQKQNQKANQMKQKHGGTLVSPSVKRKSPNKRSASIARFNHQSLVQSVVMKEVLGAPRAKKPYHPKSR